jgi:hypothetical protein
MFIKSNPNHHGWSKTIKRNVKIRAATLKVIPATRGGPQEHTGPPLGIGGSPTGSIVRSSTSFPFLLGSITLQTHAFNLPDILDLVANPRDVFFLVVIVEDACRLKNKFLVITTHLQWHNIVRFWLPGTKLLRKSPILVLLSQKHT